MKFSTREDIEAPIDFVFEQVTDFENFERQALRRGADVTRQDPDTGPGVGSTWSIRTTYRGRARRIAAELASFDRPTGMQITSATSGVEGLMAVDLLSLSPRRTRLQVNLELSPNSLTGRLLVQSLKFARSSLNKRLSKRAAEFARMVEDRHNGR